MKKLLSNTHVDEIFTFQDNVNSQHYRMHSVSQNPTIYKYYCFVQLPDGKIKPKYYTRSRDCNVHVVSLLKQ